MYKNDPLKDDENSSQENNNDINSLHNTYGYSNNNTWDGNYNYGSDHDYGRSFDQKTYEDNQNNYNSYNNSYSQNTDQSSYNRNVYHWNFNDYNQSDKLKKNPKNKNKKIKAATIISASLVVVILIVSVNIFLPKISGNNSEPVVKSPTLRSGEFISESSVLKINELPKNANSIQDESLSGGALTIKEINRKLSPSVVGIQAYSPIEFEIEPIAEASGVIMDVEGNIVTNAHVINLQSTDSIPKIKVVLTDGSSYEATLIGKDVKTDIAVIKIDAPNLIAAEFGDSELIEVGDLVVAIGNPGGLTFAGSTTNGIVSGINRQLTDNYGYTMSCIQTNAAINPGNSGGALANEYGQVIGITSSKVSSEGYEGMGFAIPIHEAKPIVDELIANGRVTGRPMIGITYKSGQIIDEMRSRIYGVPTGVIVDSIYKESDAYKKGLITSDIIHQIDDTVIDSVDDIQTAISNKKAGDSVMLVIFRRNEQGNENNSGKEFKLDIILMENSN